MLTRLTGAGVLVSVVLAVGAVTDSFAQNAPTDFSQNTPTGGPGSATGGSPSGAYKEGLQVGNWTLFPSLYAGAVYNSNINQLPQGGDGGWGAEAIPRLYGFYDGGMYRTTVYGVLDSELGSQYFGTNTLAATGGFASIYQPVQDWAFNYFGNYTRETSIFNSALNVNNGAIGPPGGPQGSIPLTLNPFGTIPTVNPIPYNQFTGGGYVTKTFNQAFVNLGATAFYILYDQQADIPEPFQTSSDGTSIWVTGKVGYHVIPALYVFGEGDGIFQRFNNSLFNTNGYRVIGGLGSDDPNSLFRGEIYGGYQYQQQVTQDALGTTSIPLVAPNGIPFDVGSGVFGGRVAYYPTPYWTFIGSVDQVVGISTQLSPGVPEGIPSKVTTAMLQTNYSISRDWWVGARFGYTQGYFFGIVPEDQGWLAGASFNYAIWRNLFLTLDYQYTILQSDVALNRFSQSQFTAGVTYKY
jgi:Putative beta-barrel porin 2